MHYLLLLLLLSIYVEQIEGDISNAELVYPERIHAHRSKRDLSTHVKTNQHEDSLTFRIKSKQEGDLVVDLKREEPVHDKLLVRTYADDGTPVHTYHDHPNCFYSGSIQDKRDSYAYVSSCNGLTGSLDTGTRRYDIEPHKESGGHTLSNVDDEIENIAKSLKIATGDVKDIMETLRDENDDDEEEEDEEDVEDITVVEATSSSVSGDNNGRYGAARAWKGGSFNHKYYFISKEEDNPWLQIKLNKVARITSVTIVNRKEGFGELLRNVEVRAGMEPGLGNEVVGEFEGPGWTGGIHGIMFKKPVDAQFLTFQVRGRGILQINGIRFNQAKTPVVKWREDLKCGGNNKLPNGETSECDPNSEYPCCDGYKGLCGTGGLDCLCDRCHDYRFGKSTLRVNKTNSEASENVIPFELFNVEKQYLPYITYPYTRYVEMFISMDTELYLRFNKDTNLCIERILNVVGHVDKSYSAINVRLVVVAIEIQNNGPVWERMYSSTEVKMFRFHWNKIRKEDAFKDIPMDSAVLFSGHHWNYKGGVAFGSSMCRSYSASINWWGYGVLGSTVILGHELGHTFGWHDYSEGEGGPCPCLAIPLKRGCFMGGHKGSQPGFNLCNMETFAVRNNRYQCLNNRPVNPLHTHCGNGIREKGEECDCGTPENCAREDPCCEPHGCKLKAEAQCNFHNDPACCDTTCQFKRQGSLCREATSNCDVPEYCTGETAICPADRFIADGTHCGESKKLVLGTNREETHFRRLTPPVTGRYFKIIPVHWTKDQKACMKLELYGCDPNQDKPLYNHIGCWKDTSTRAIQTLEGKDGRLDGNYRRRANAIQKCYQAAELRGFKYFALQHGGWCASSANAESRYNMYGESTRCRDGKGGGWANDVYVINDCPKPLGLENKTIADSAISAAPSSSPASDVRMGNGEPWCSANKKDGSWIKVDVGKKVELGYIAIKGLREQWVDAFYIMYSDNGFMWKYYKENNDNTTEGSNSYCFNGECALTRDHQCRKLWDAGASSASDKCWNKLNTNTEGYGTCNPSEISPCNKSNVMCGQIQCTSPKSSPYYENYGKDYETVTIDGQKCSAAKIVNANDDIGEGMVRDGTKCGDGKICINQECKTLKDLGKIPSCGLVNGKICGGRGQCMEKGKCYCDGLYNPEDNCATEMAAVAAVDGGWSEWSPWSKCTATCKQRRHRFCDKPFAKHNGKDCVGDRVEEKECNGAQCLDLGMVPGPVIGNTVRGEWSKYVRCPPRKRIIGFRLKVKTEEENGTANDDDTALKGIDLLCEGNTASATIEKEGGTWNKWKACQDEYVKEIDFLETTNMRVKCTRVGLDGGDVIVGDGASGGEWVGYTACPSGTIFCGARAQIDEGGGNAFNRIQLACCPETKVVRWRDDGRCGVNFRLSNYEKSECNPKAGSPCCSTRGFCSVSWRSFCDCVGCMDYRLFDIKVVEANSSSVYNNDNGSWGPMLAWKGDSGSRIGYFHSINEEKPWLQIKLNKVASITNVTVINRKDCCGSHLKNLEVRAGMEPGLTNEVAGEFKGPGLTNGKYLITFTKPVDAQYLTFQLKQKGILQINGIRFNQPEESHSNVWCTRHPAYDCSGCPQGVTRYCSGDCKWCNGVCQLKDKCA